MGYGAGFPGYGGMAMGYGNYGYGAYGGYGGYGQGPDSRGAYGSGYGQG